MAVEVVDRETGEIEETEERERVDVARVDPRFIQTRQGRPSPVEVRCGLCGSTRSVPPSVVARGWGRFCRTCKPLAVAEMNRKSGPARRLARFEAKTQRTAGCWVWTGARDRHGYGRLGRPNVMVHRLAYELAYGSVPAGHVVRHTCGNRACVRPEHLRAEWEAGPGVLPQSDVLCVCGCGERTMVNARGVPNRYVDGHQNRRPGPDWLAEDRGYVTPCWIWQRYVNPKIGYGHTGQAFAHRWVYERLRGRVPKPLVLDHLCRVRACVNPDHLQMVTESENCRRGDAAKRLTKLTPQQRYEVMVSTEPRSIVAQRYGISTGYVGDLRKGRRGPKWR